MRFQLLLLYTLCCLSTVSGLACPINVFLALDASSSISRSDFNRELAFATQLVSAVGVGTGAHHAALGALQFAASTALIAPLERDAQALQNALNHTRQLGGGTALGRALAEGGKQLPLQGNGTAAPNVLVLVTDGQNSAGPSPVPIADALKAQVWTFSFIFFFI